MTDLCAVPSFEAEVEFTCRVCSDEKGDIKIFALKYEKEKKKWSELDVTDYIPLDEALRVQSLSENNRRDYFHKLGRSKKLWR